MSENPVERYYDTNAEKEWGRTNRHRTEFAVTRRVLIDYLPTGRLKIADIGGGPGRYAIFLARLGHQVTLVDLSTAELEIALARAQEAGTNLCQIIQANALDLSNLPPNEFDAVLLMGPLYHLQEEKDRRRAVDEALRILKPGCLLFAAFITRFAPYRDYAANLPEDVFAEKEGWLRMLEDGRNFGEGFPGAFFEHPNHILPFMESCGLQTLQMIGVEGVTAGHEDKINALQGEMFEFWADLNYRLGRDPILWGSANHLLYVGRKPND